MEEIYCSSDPLDSSSIPVDTDGDLLLDCVDTDDDNDGTEDNSDAFPLDPTEDTDTDSDGIGNNTDTDDDGDGVLDVDDSFPLDETEWIDTDLDGTGNNTDLDDDNDGILDSQEENLDTDGDGITNDVDTDDDGDGIPTIDEDANGNGDPTDDDQDGDGIYDALESSVEDTDSDGVVDQQDTENEDPYNDQDGDGYPNADEITGGADPMDDQSFPEDFKSTNFNIIITDFFSPNGDGFNDTWQVKEIERYSNNRVWIFVRTGKQIFSANPYMNNWSGEYNGSPVPSGSYYYRIDLDGNGNIDFEGWLYLSR